AARNGARGGGGMGVVKRLRLACALVAVAATARAAQIEDVSPRGTVKQPRQVTVRFGAPMVALGDPRAAAPFAVACTPPVAGSGHWIDSRTYAVELARELPGGERCAIDLLPDLRDRAGRPVEGERHFEFSTGGPSVTETRPAEGSEIAEDQAFVLVLDADPKPASVEAHAYFAADGIAERIPVAIASADVRTAILALDPDDRPTGPVLVLQARQRFPAEAAVKLVWGPGIESATGIATAEEQSFEYKTRPAFRAEIRCERARRLRPARGDLAPLHRERRRGGRRAGRARRPGREALRAGAARHARPAGDARDLRAALPARDRAPRRRPCRPPRRRRPSARERRRAAHAAAPGRRRSAAREVRRPLRHPGGEGRPGTPRHDSRPRAGGSDAGAGRRRAGGRREGARVRRRREDAAHRRERDCGRAPDRSAGRDHPLAAPRRGRSSRPLGL